MNIIFLGAPGSGKGTQASLLAKELKIPAISTGEVLRKEVDEKTEVGKLADSYMKSGRLVPDEVVVDIVKNRIIREDCQLGFILDGFPRNMSQAVILDSVLNVIGKKIGIVFNFQVNEEVLLKRVSGRFFCKSCGTIYNHYFKIPRKQGVCDNCGSTHFENRVDDNEATLQNRLKIYHESTFELIDYYEKKNLLFTVEAVKSAPLISEELIEVVSKLSFQKNN